MLMLDLKIDHGKQMFASSNYADFFQKIEQSHETTCVKGAKSDPYHWKPRTKEL